MTVLHCVKVVSETMEDLTLKSSDLTVHDLTVHFSDFDSSVWFTGYYHGTLHRFPKNKIC